MALEGTLRYLDIAHLLHVVGVSKKSGVLEISSEDRRVRLLFQRGELTCAEAEPSREGIGTLLVRSGLLRPEALDMALAVQQEEKRGGIPPRRLGAILCDDFGTHSQDIETLLRHQFEQIAFEAFSWSAGTFVLEFQEPTSAWDRFRLDAVEFILSVGIQAGLIAQEGIERERAAAGRPHLLFLDDNQGLLAACAGEWRQRGWRVTCFSNAQDLYDCVAAWDASVCPPVVAGYLRRPLTRDQGVSTLKALKALSPEASAVIVETPEGDAPDRLGGAAGADVFLVRPRSADLRGPRREDCLRGFMAAFERALGLVLAEKKGERVCAAK